MSGEEEARKNITKFSKNPPLISGGGFFVNRTGGQRRIGGKNE
jgi:hypothetical protein